MLIKRNLLLFFRDKSNVFFSLFSVFIVIGLYVMFIGGIMEANLNNILGFTSGRVGVAVSSLMLGGLVAITSVSSCLGAIAISIRDREGPAKDFFTSPISRGKITYSYIIGSGGVGLVMTTAALALCLLYIVSRGGNMPTPTDMVLLAITTVLSVLCANAIVFCMASFAQTPNAFSAMGSVVSTLIGFLMGVYIPAGQLPEAVQWVIRVFPMSHAASMYRLILADGELGKLFEEAGAPQEALQEFREFFGVVFYYGGFESSFWLSAAWLAVSTVVFFGISLVFVSRRKG